MTLKNPRDMYKSDPFEKQDQDGPALQNKMIPNPDCGEKSYKGNNKLTDRKVLITGGDSGIGRAVAIAFAREGADVAIQFLPGEESDAKEVEKYITEAGRKALLIPMDFKNFSSDELIKTVVDEFGSIDTLVLNAGQQYSQPDITQLDIRQLENTFKVNILSMFEIVKSAWNFLPAGGTIITTTSIQSFNPSAHLLDYASTKGAITNLTINLAQQLADRGIRVNGVAPGPIWTPLQLDGGQPNDKIPEFGQNTLLGRAGQPVELAPTYVLLASNEASYITGQIYGITGGGQIN